jgi:hypothetical protein
MATTSTYRRELFWLGVFGVAFGYLEAAVVLYLRAIAYPAGFAFPLEPVTRLVLGAEIGREAATLAMFAGVSLAGGGPRFLRLSRFLYCFGLWDIAFYIGLKALLNWPASPMTWDVLFLIPVPWSAPVFAPALVAAYFVAVGSYGIVKKGDVRPQPWQWVVGAAGSLLILVTFFWNVGPCLRNAVPTSYPWILYGLGFAALVAAFAAVAARPGSVNKRNDRVA